ncbi:TetR/AcrR family transcriptional regulator [Methylobrevis pamukkalensis]|uniref:Putative HTH-type transcriptional regulator YfiR n=1 Tax=Methylobrevis pamukkalensis TaxID=1439726 RepID=A0A1E3H432_9HYPH|nr:TetR/AcrR family transcriptional regulator [Methylobrevis pamukkalensis]ODN71072.1 putative HTH-type transcriptional regulator YfiR [Methylobrevis pamukkalensis]
MTATTRRPRRARTAAIATDPVSAETGAGGEKTSGRAEAGVNGTAGAAEILQRVALDLFAQQNYSTVTIKDIADATGFNASLIYYYFGSKEALFMKAVETTVEDAFKHFEAITAKATSPEEIISLWIEVHIRQYVPLQKLAKISLDYASTHNRTPRIDRAIQEFYDKEAALLGKAIRDGIRDGIFRPVKPADTVVFISTFLDGSLFRNVMFPSFNYAAAIRNMRKIVLGHLRV